MLCICTVSHPFLSIQQYSSMGCGDDLLCNRFEFKKHTLQGPCRLRLSATSLFFTPSLSYLPTARAFRFYGPLLPPAHARTLSRSRPSNLSKTSSNHVSFAVYQKHPPSRSVNSPRPAPSSRAQLLIRLSLITLTGKQGRTAQAQDDPTTHVSPVNVHQHQHQQGQQTHGHAPPPQNHYANTDPNLMAHQAHQVPKGDAYSMAAGDGKNKAAQAGNAAAHAAGNHQKVGSVKQKHVPQEDIARIVAEENENKGKLPKYPGLERWTLIEKMGDGAFSNVYKARDTTGQVGEVAIKVVRKFEMNSSQVSIGEIASPFIALSRSYPLPTRAWLCRATHTFIRTSRSNQRLWRCALLFLQKQKYWPPLVVDVLSLWVMFTQGFTLIRFDREPIS